MDFFSLQFAYALATIVVIDIVLAGDNAIVIALAARNIPRPLQRRAIMWGTAGAVLVRTLLTVVVVWLLKIPGLLLAGGALLLWIAYRLLDDGDEGGHAVTPAASFWGAMKTIVVADAVMGLDNVLAVAGAAQGNFVLVVLGLLISIPIVVWGSTMILHLVERYPAIIYFGAGVLAWTAAKMMASEPLVKSYLEGHGTLVMLVQWVIVVALVGIGYAINRRKALARTASSADEVSLESVDDASASGAGLQPERAPSAAVRAIEPVTGRHLVTEFSTKEIAMKNIELDTPNKQLSHEKAFRILVPLDGSPTSLMAVGEARRIALEHPGCEIHLLNVQPSLNRHMARFLSREAVISAAASRARAVTSKVCKELARSGLGVVEALRVGPVAASIGAYARDAGIDQLVVAARRKNLLARLCTGSVVNRIIGTVDRPVAIVSGDAAGLFERWVLPAGIGVGLTALVLAVD